MSVADARSAPAGEAPATPQSPRANTPQHVYLARAALSAALSALSAVDDGAADDDAQAELLLRAAAEIRSCVEGDSDLQRQPSCTGASRTDSLLDEVRRTVTELHALCRADPPLPGGDATLPSVCTCFRSQCIGIITPLLRTPVPSALSPLQSSNARAREGAAGVSADAASATHLLPGRPLLLPSSLHNSLLGARSDSVVQGALAELASAARSAREESAQLRRALTLEQARNADLQKALSAVAAASPTQGFSPHALERVEQALARERMKTARLLAVVQEAYAETEMLRAELEAERARARASPPTDSAAASTGAVL